VEVFVSKTVLKLNVISTDVGPCLTEGPEIVKWRMIRSVGHVHM